MIWLEKMGMHRLTGCNYVTSVNGMLHPDRVMAEHDFLYMLDGEWEIWEEERAYQLRTDDLLILTAGQHHFGRRLCNPGNQHMYLHVQPTPAEQEALRSGSKAEGDGPDRTARTASLFACPTLLHCQANPRIRQCFQEIIAASWTYAAERENRLSLLFSLLLCELAALPNADMPPKQPDPVTDQIVQRIRSTPQTFFTAEEIAAEYYICARTLNNRFRSFCGKTFCAFQMETHLEMARQFLLSQPQAKLREAALNYGFYDEFHLSRAFKRQFGLSPSQFRKNK
ncbi:MAG: AraC family transcriptional regulator [Eubacteriales bacterium]|nr:AraC family transcriptional regulator [Eubacteriales bacterium]